MAQNITLLGASYPDVPAVELPKTGGGTALFTDVTDTTATAEDVLEGVYFYTAAGVLTEGTGTGGGVLVVESEDQHGGTIIDITAEIIRLQSKNATPSESEQTITPDTSSGYKGLSQVVISAISSTYVGSGVSRKSSSDLTASGATVTVPAGYYENQASKSVASGTVTAPSTISGTSATVSTGTNTLTLSKTVSVTPNVSTAGYISSGTAGNSSVSLTASVTTKGAATITPGTSNQTIASGTYLTGTQTISGDANLIPANIASGVTIFGVVGTHSGGGGGKNVQVYSGIEGVHVNTYTATSVSIKASKAGTYKISWMGWRNTTSGTSGSQVYVNDTAKGSAHTTFTTNYGQYCEESLTLAANDVVTVYARSRNTSYYMYVGNLIIEEQ